MSRDLRRTEASVAGGVAASVHADKTVFTVVTGILIGGAVLCGLIVTDKTR
jgi:hypothetical protein